jgi:Acyl-CoA dehydrogenase, C-terminal domain
VVRLLRNNFAVGNGFWCKTSTHRSSLHALSFRSRRVFAALSLLTRSIEAADYNYPYRDPYLATATSAILGNDEATARVESNVLRVPGLPDRNKLPSLERRGDLSLAFYRQNQAAPLLFILAGVGSNPYFGVVDDVFVPLGDSLAPAPPVATNSSLAQLPIIPMMVAGIGAQFLGMARVAMAVTIEILRNKVSVDPGASIRERSSVLADIASYSAAVTAAGSHLHASMEAMWDKVRHQLPTAEDRAALYSASLYAANVARAGVEAMHAAAGTTALYVDCPLERSIRDLQTMERHIAAQSIWLEDAERVLVGHEPINPLFMI